MPGSSARDQRRIESRKPSVPISQVGLLKNSVCWSNPQVGTRLLDKALGACWGVV